MTKGRAGKTSRTAKVREDDYTKQGPRPNAMQHLPWPSLLSPSGLAPVLCNHGLAVLPIGHPAMAGSPRYNANHEETPPFGGHSFVRAKYARGNSRCEQCATGIRPDDLTESREAISG